MSLTRPFAVAAFLRNLRVPNREINPARKIAGPHMNIAPSASTSNQCWAPLRGRAVRLPTRHGTPRASSKREWFHLFMRDLAYLLLVIIPIAPRTDVPMSQDAWHRRNSSAQVVLQAARLSWL